MSLKSTLYTVSDKLFLKLTNSYNKEGKNSHIGNRAVAIVEEYLSTQYPTAKLTIGTQGGDLDMLLDGETIRYEIKGTESESIAFNKLRVSSQACHDALKAGMTLIRVCNVGKKNVELYFLKYGEDFELKPECRWIIKPIQRKSNLKAKI